MSTDWVEELSIPMTRLWLLAFLIAFGSLGIPAQVQFQERGKEHIPFRGTSPLRIRVGDIDADGDLDLVFGERRFSRNGGGNEMVLYRNEGDAIFTPELTAMHFRGLRSNFLLADFDEDADLDIIFEQDVFTPGGPILWLNDGLGGYSPAPLAARFPSDANQLAAADLDGDGDLDLFVAERKAFTSLIKVWLNDGHATYAQAAVIEIGGYVESTCSSM